MFFLLFDFELIRRISGNGLLKITRYAGEIANHETAHTVSLISPSKSSSSSNTSNGDPTSIRHHEALARASLNKPKSRERVLLDLVLWLAHAVK